LNRDPSNQAAQYYLGIAKQSRDRQVVDARNVTSMQRMVKVEDRLVADSNSGASTNPELATRTFKANPNVFYNELKAAGDLHAPAVSAPAQTNSRGLRYVTGLDTTSEIQTAVTQYLHSAGVDLNGSKSVFFDDRQGTLTVHATDQDLDKIAAATDKLMAEGVTAQSKSVATEQTDAALPKPAIPPPTPQPEVLTRENAFSTFSLNVSDVSFKLAAASLEKGQLPEPASIRSEEFINAFDYRDPEALPGVPIAFTAERAAYPFAHNRELLRFSLKTAAAGRQAGRPLNIVLLLDNSGSMERADRVRIIQEALRVLAGQLQAQDTFSIVTFARTARLQVDGIPGNQADAAAEEIAKLTPEGGTNLGDALDLAYETALHHYLANGDNRVVMLTDGAANLGEVNGDALKQKVEAHRKQGVALDCFGIGWEGYNDDLLEVLTRNGDGRYGFINTPEEAGTTFVAQIAGALHVAAADVKVQVEFNPKRVVSYRQIGYAKHQLTKEQFRDNTVDAAEIAAQEAGNALYTIETNPQGEGSIATVRVRYKVPGTSEFREQAWDVPYTGSAVALEQASPAMRLAATASAFSEWLSTSPFAAEVTPDELLRYLNGVPQVYGADTRPTKLEWMIRQAKSISGK
jgi:Mg-chelatase subunit ChlD